MARHNVWFGTRDYMTWVPAPAADTSTYEAQRWRASGQYLNGGAYSVSSATGAQRISLTWNPMPRDDVDLLRAFFDGAYGPGPFYYADPFGAENILPSWLSLPYQNYSNAPGFKEFGKGSPHLETATPGTQGYPTKLIRYDGVEGSKSWDIPVPPNTTFELGVRGRLDNSTSGPNGTIRLNNVVVPPLSVNDALRYATNGAVSGGANGAWATISLNQASGQSPALQGLMGRYIGQEGNSTVQTYGRFIPGRGFGGLKLAEDPTITRYSSVLNREAISATFVEAQPWEL